MGCTRSKHISTQRVSSCSSCFLRESSGSFRLALWQSCMERCRRVRYQERDAVLYELQACLPPQMLLLWHLPQSMEEAWGRWALRLRGEKLSQSRGTESIGFFSILRLFIALHNPEWRHCAANSDKMACYILLEENCLLEQSPCFQTYMFRIHVQTYCVSPMFSHCSFSILSRIFSCFEYISTP